MTYRSEAAAMLAIIRAADDAEQPRDTSPRPSPVIAPELRNPDETAAEHLRNAATIVALCNIGIAGALVLSPADADALRGRLRAALAKLEPAPAAVRDPAQRGLEL